MPKRLDDLIWGFAGLALVAAVAFGLRFGTHVLSKPEIRDEALMRAPIDDILTRGWSVETAIDYQEVKGPVFFWTYAVGGELLGDSMNALRLVSVLLFVAGVVPLLLIARRGGISGATLGVISVLYVLLPYNGFVAQLLMSEPSFVFYAMWLVFLFVWGFGDSMNRGHRVWGPVCFGVVLSLLLHHRPHAVAFAGAAVLTAFERDRFRCWPWVVACALAGLSRLPLWFRWGGLVTSDYQELFGLGVRWEGLAYLLGVVGPATAVFLFPALFDSANRPRRWWIALGGGLGVLLGLMARLDLSGTAEYLLQGQPMSQSEYAGVLATSVRTMLDGRAAQVGALTIFAGLGGASLGAMAAVAWSKGVNTQDGAVRRLAFWMLAAGIPLYVVTSGPIYDRHLMVWYILLPIVWATSLVRPILIVQATGLALILGYFVHAWLM